MNVTLDLSKALAGRYVIERELGAGGMATVYLAHDVKHERKVAIKVLKPELAAVLGAERFIVEIKTTAALQHPHILPLFDSGTADGQLYYVMPYIQGETIREKLNRETQFGVDEAVRIAREVADALDYAHRHGVIHRDIKPENILLHDGRAMVMDFGIALAVSAAAGGRMTETGLSLGTPHYMSPEQATAEKEISGRSDVYSLASVLYEMLAGEPPHSGGSAQAIIMKIIAEPVQPVTTLRKSVPPNVDAAIAKALEKVPADRFGSAKAFADALIDVHFSSAGTAGDGPIARSRAVRIATRVALPFVAIVAAAAGWLGHKWTTHEIAPEPIQFATRLGPPGIGVPSLAISADGRRLQSAGPDSLGVSGIEVRDLRTNTLSRIPGTEGAQYGGTFSPDGEWIAFVVDATLRKVSVRGGPVTILVDSLLVDEVPADWTLDNNIIFTGRATGLWKVSANGGRPVQLTKIDTSRREFAHWSPQVLPGGHAMIYTNYATPMARARIEAFDFASGRSTVLVEGAVYGRYSPTGHLLYARDAAVYAIAFDPVHLRTDGVGTLVQDNVAWDATDGLAGYAISDNGTFAYLRESEWTAQVAVTWRDAAGRDTPAIDAPGAFLQPRLSPDGRWIAVTNTRPKDDIFIYDVKRRALTQLTHAPAYAFNPLWMPDSRQIIYTFEDRVYELHTIPIDDKDADRPLMSSAFDKYATSVSPDGASMLITETRGVHRLLLAGTDGKRPPDSFAETGPSQRAGVFSPDGRWIAFEEGPVGRAEIYIRSAAGTGARHLVSAGKGKQPRWIKGGHEIVYAGDSAMMRARVDLATGEADAPAPLFGVSDIEFAGHGNTGTHGYDVTPDGTRFLLLKRMERPAALPLIVTLNWRPALPQRVPK